MGYISYKIKIPAISNLIDKMSHLSFIDEPLMCSQFCYHIQQDEHKHRATVHINRKPSEQVEVDWVGDFASIINPNTGENLKTYVFVGV